MSGTFGRRIAELQDTLDRAQAQVDGALAVRYPVPLVDPPQLARDLVLDLATWEATLQYYGSVPMEPRDPVQLRYDRAVSTLRDLATGRALLTSSVPAEPPSVGAVGGGFDSVARDRW